jgi:hypothetical protein
MSKTYFIAIRIISIVTLIAFLSGQAAWGYEASAASGYAQKSNLRLQQPDRSKTAPILAAALGSDEPVEPAQTASRPAKGPGEAEIRRASANGIAPNGPSQEMRATTAGGEAEGHLVIEVESFAELIRGHFAGRDEIRGFDFGAGIGNITQKVKEILEEIFMDVNFLGLDNEPRFIEFAKENGFPVEYIDLENSYWTDSLPKCDLVTMFNPQPRTLYFFLKTAKRIIKNEGLIVVLLNTDDMDDLFNGRWVFNEVSADTIWQMLSDFTLVKFSQRAQEEVLWRICPYAFVYSPQEGAQGLDRSVAIVGSPATDDVNTQVASLPIEVQQKVSGAFLNEIKVYVGLIKQRRRAFAIVVGRKELASQLQSCGFEAVVYKAADSEIPAAIEELKDKHGFDEGNDFVLIAAGSEIRNNLSDLKLPLQIDTDVYRAISDYLADV